MNRIFHVKIAGGTYFLLILLTAVMVFAFWCMKAMIGLVVALGLIIIIERIIHSTYTLTADGKLVVYYGRFYKGKTIPLTDITDVELKRSSGFGGIMPSKYVLIHYEKKNLLSLVPVKPEEFINALVKRLEHRIEEELIMEKVFKTKRTRNWWIIIVGLVVLIIFLNVYLEKSWAFSALGGIIIPVLMFYSRSKTTYIVKDNGVLEIKPGWGNRICVDGIRKVSYNPNAIGMQKVKIEHAQGFVMINPDKPLEFVEALIKIDPNLSVEGFEQIKTN